MGLNRLALKSLNWNFLVSAVATGTELAGTILYIFYLAKVFMSFWLEKEMSISWECSKKSKNRDQLEIYPENARVEKKPTFLACGDVERVQLPD